MSNSMFIVLYAIAVFVGYLLGNWIALRVSFALAAVSIAAAAVSFVVFHDEALVRVLELPFGFFTGAAFRGMGGKGRDWELDD